MKIPKHNAITSRDCEDVVPVLNTSNRLVITIVISVAVLARNGGHHIERHDRIFLSIFSKDPIRVFQSNQQVTPFPCQSCNIAIDTNDGFGLTLMLLLLLPLPLPLAIGTTASTTILGLLVPRC